MLETRHAGLLTPEQAALQATPHAAANGVRYTTLGNLEGPNTSAAEMARLVGAVPAAVAAGLSTFVYLFVPLVLSGARLDGEESGPLSSTDSTLIAPAYTAALAEKAICHRNSKVGDAEYVFLSSRLHADRFALAFEFFINIAHNFVDTVGAPSSFGDLAWNQATANVRGETSIDAWEERAAALGVSPPGSMLGSARSKPPVLTGSPAGRTDEKARTAYQSAAFADALAIYLLSLYLDFDYTDLREREYPLLAAPALADRLRAVSKLFPPNEGYQFQILYRRRS